MNTFASTMKTFPVFLQAALAAICLQRDKVSGLQTKLI